jgi:hypothetical protein
MDPGLVWKRTVHGAIDRIGKKVYVSVVSEGLFWCLLAAQKNFVSSQPRIVHLEDTADTVDCMHRAVFIHHGHARPGTVTNGPNGWSTESRRLSESYCASGNEGWRQ